MALDLEKDQWRWKFTSRELRYVWYFVSALRRSRCAQALDKVNLVMLHMTWNFYKPSYSKRVSRSYNFMSETIAGDLI